MTLAIGMGASTGVFSVINALLLRSLPFHDSERLALMRDFIPPHDSAKEFHGWRQDSAYLSDAALFEENDANLGGGRVATRAHVVQTTWNFFSVLDVQTVLGRGLAPGDDVDGTGWGTPGPNSEAVIGYGLWHELFGDSPTVLGATIRVDGNPLTVVGVAPPGFDYPGKAVVWKAAAFSPGNNGWKTIARLKPGVSWAQARAAFGVEVARQTQAGKFDSNNLHPNITPLREGMLGKTKDASLVFMGAVSIVLLIACINVANLLLARTVERATEFATRSALGASRVRLARQLFSECLLLSAVSALLGLAIAYGISCYAATVVPSPVAQSSSWFDQRMFFFTLGILILSSFVFGIVPLVVAGRSTGFFTRSNTARNSRQFGEWLIAAQVMLSMLLFASSVSLGRAFIHLMRMDRGYDVQGVVTASVALDGTPYQPANRRLPYFENVLDRVRRLPGVRSASATEFLPLYAQAFVGGPFQLDHRPAARSSTMIPVLSGYFRTMGVPILFGREFEEAELRSGARVAVVNEQFADEFGPPQNAIGHQLTMDSDSWTIVGVVKAMEYETDPTLAGGNQVFVPSTAPGAFFSTFVVRVDGRAEDYLASVRDTIQSVDPQVPLFGVKTMEQRMGEFFVRPKFFRTSIWLFAGFTILLAVIGIYGVVTNAVVQRNREMGIRIALGRTSVQIRGMLLKKGLLTVGAGALAGIAGAQLTGRLLAALADGAKPVGVESSGVLLVFFTLIASASIWFGSRRIATLDVISLLRSE